MVPGCSREVLVSIKDSWIFLRITDGMGGYFINNFEPIFLSGIGVRDRICLLLFHLLSQQCCALNRCKLEVTERLLLNLGNKFTFLQRWRYSSKVMVGVF